MTRDQPALPLESPAPPARPPVVIRRSARRKRTVSAHFADGTIVVSLPAGLSAAEEQRWVDHLVARVLRRERRGVRSDTVLAERAAALSRELFDGRAKPSGVRWSDQMARRWGSCTVDTRAIRLSHRLQTMPAWVVDYVLVHELAHLLEANHSPAFWELVGRYPRAERARGWLEGWESGRVAGGGASGDGSDEEDDLD